MSKRTFKTVDFLLHFNRFFWVGGFLSFFFLCVLSLAFVFRIFATGKTFLIRVGSKHDILFPFFFFDFLIAMHFCGGFFTC